MRFVMRAIKLHLSGKFAHFKKPETGNNPCTYAYMHKCAFLGFMGAVLGINRKEFNHKQFCNDFLYGIKINNPIIKEPISFTKRGTTPSEFYKQGLRYCEFIKDPSYNIVLCLKNKNSIEYFEKFKKLLINKQTYFPVYFGVISCLCDFIFIDEYEAIEKTGEFSTQYVFSSKHESLKTNFEELLYEKTPVSEADMFYTAYEETVCPSTEIEVSGNYFELSNNEKMWLM